LSGRRRTRSSTRPNVVAKAPARSDPQRPGLAGVSGTPFQRALTEAAVRGLTVGASALARDPYDGVSFGPGQPFAPAVIDPARPDSGRPEPRGSQYDITWNLKIGNDRHIPWRILRDAADNVDIIRRCIQVRKRHFKTLKWTWTVKAEAIQEAYEADPKRGQEDVGAELREKYKAEIKRLNAFWRNPWRGHLRTLKQWANMAQEEMIVLDALAIYPQRDRAGRVHSFRIIDGSTIKPLLNSQGSTPAPPYPAYQQVLYGFPRGEYTASPVTDEDGNPVLDANGHPQVESPFDSDELFYWRENPRSFSPYGHSEVEQALNSARLYLKRQGWMISEYDDGTTPVTWLVPDGVGASELDHKQRRRWEDALNDEMAGRTRARHRIKVTPPGFKPELQPSEAERYKPEYDLHLIKLVASHLSVTIAELGFTEAKGLGSSGYHEGQEDVQDRNGRRPDIESMADVINSLSYEYLDAPPELEIQFTGLEAEDEDSADEVADRRVRGARSTLNEDRRRQGQPLYGFPEADMPMIITERGIIFLEGASQQAPPGELIQPVQAPPPTDPTDPATDGTDPADAGQDRAERDGEPKPDRAVQPPGKPAKNPAPAPGKPNDAPPANPQKSAAPAAPRVPDLTAEQVAEIGAFRRYVAKRAGRTGGRRFEFKALTEERARLAGLLDDDTAGLAEFPAGEQRPKA
jgi:hypothetical protein